MYVEDLPEVNVFDVHGNTKVKETIITLAMEIKKIYSTNSFNYQKKFYDPNIGSLLFHGVSGVGKTEFTLLLANLLKDVCTFFTLTSGSLISKYQGESEKQLRLLFQMAREVAPTIIFIDEAENLFANKGDAVSSNQTTANMACEMLTTMNNLKDIYIVAATNYPWKMDKAFRRRFPYIIHLGLPDTNDIALIIKYMLRKDITLITDRQYMEIAKKMKGYTPGDILKIKTGLLQKKTYEMTYNNYYKESEFFPHCLTPCNKLDPDAKVLGVNQLLDENIVMTPITAADIFDFIKSYKKSVTEQNMSEHMMFAQNPDYVPKIH